MKLIRVVLVILLSLGIQQRINAQEFDYEMKKHQRAPFDGVLLSNDSYRDLSVREKEHTELLKEYLELRSDCLNDGGSVRSEFYPFMMGVILGTIAGFIIAK